MAWAARSGALLWRNSLISFFHWSILCCLVVLSCAMPARDRDIKNSIEMILLIKPPCMLFPNTPMLQQICQSVASGASPAAIRRKFFMSILFFRNYCLYYEREFKLDLTYENVRYNTDHSRIDLPAFPFCGSCHRLSRSRPVDAIRHYGRFLDQRNRKLSKRMCLPAFMHPNYPR